MLQSVTENSASINKFYRRVAVWFTSMVENTNSKSTIAPLDGVRAIACLSVIMFHVSLKAHAWDLHFLGHNAISIIMAGDAGVTLFFVLSGFLLFLPYVKSLLFDAPWPSLKFFYLRRALRIIPGYYLSLFLMILIWHPEYLRVDHLKQLALFLLFFMDSTRGTFQQINGPFWTLAVEWQFYLLLPWLALAMRLVVQRGSVTRRVWSLVGCLATLVCWGVFARFAGLYLNTYTTITWLVPRQVLNVALFFLYGTDGPGLHGKFLEDFALGMFVAFCYTMARRESLQGIVGTWTRTLQRLSPWLWGVGLIWLFLMALWESSMSAPQLGGFGAILYGMYNILHELGISLGFSSCVLAILFGSAGLKAMFAWRPLRWVGLISYSMYMWHLPLIQTFMDGIAPYTQHWKLIYSYSLDWLWVLVAVIPFSFLFFVLVEKPWIGISDNLRKRGTKKQYELSKQVE